MNEENNQVECIHCLQNPCVWEEHREVMCEHAKAIADCGDEGNTSEEKQSY